MASVKSTTSFTEKNTNKTALESLLKITEVLKNTLSIKENSDNVDEQPVQNNTSTKTTYNNGKCIIPPNKNTIEIIQGKVDQEAKYKDDFVINLNDLTSKGKLTFETKINVTYSYTYNLVNIIPNPLYNELINDKYDNDIYATGDLNGELNTSYLKLNKKNIANNISKDYYLPSIGELGISMENIQTINDSIDALGEEYADCKIPYDAVIASSSLYSSTPITNSNYIMTNNLNNVWCFDNKEAKISYQHISNKFTIIPFYKFQNNVVINLEEEIEDVVINSIITITSQLEGDRYIELNSPIHNFKLSDLSDFNTSNWLEHPFNSKYFFNILFPEVGDFISVNDNFTNLHNDYLSYYTYKYYIEGEKYINCLASTSKPTYFYYDVENSSYCQKDIHSNNGILLPSYAIPFESSYIIQTKTSDFWKRYLIYNVSIYGNHMVLMPIYGSGENKYNLKKNKTQVLLYVTIPSVCTDFNCKMNNTTDCDISIYKSYSIKSFNIYEINLYFKEDVPTDNVLIFSCNYKGDIITKKYFYSIYSLLISNNLSNKKSSTYFSIDNYYVAKDPYYWWKANKWNNLYSNWTKSPIVNYSYHIDKQLNHSIPCGVSYSYTFCDGFGKLLDQTYSKANIKFMAYADNTYSYVTLASYTNTTYSKYYSRFNQLSYSYFNIMYDMSYMINLISENMNIADYGTVTDRGLRLDRLIDDDVKNEIQFAYSNDFEYINGLNQFYSYFIQNIFTPNHDYHLFTINSYYSYYSNNISYYKNDQEDVMDLNDRTYFKPIIRINRTTDNFGIYNDLIFSYVTNDIKNHYRITCNSDTGILAPYQGNYKIRESLTFSEGESFEYDYDDMYKSNNTLVWHNNVKGHYSSEDEIIVDETIYSNKFNLNIPIVGAKQSICLGLDMIDYISKNIFKGGESGQEDLFYYYNYLFSDYLFLFNNTNTVVTILISDPSLSLISKQHAIIQLKPKEFKLYYPNNFNYNGSSNYSKKKIYTIKIINKTTNIPNIIFEYYNFGSLNKSLKELSGENEFNKQLGYRLITNLIYHYYNYTHNNIELSRVEILNLYLSIMSKVYNNTENDEGIEKIKGLIQNMPNKWVNNLNIDIQNYSENQAGHLVIINSNKLFKKDEFYSKIDTKTLAQQNNWFSVDANQYDKYKYNDPEIPDSSGQHHGHIIINGNNSTITSVETNGNSTTTNP